MGFGVEGKQEYKNVQTVILEKKREKKCEYLSKNKTLLCFAPLLNPFGSCVSFITCSKNEKVQCFYTWGQRNRNTVGTRKNTPPPKKKEKKEKKERQREVLEISATILHLDGPDSSAHDSKATYWIVLEQYTKSLRGDINVFGSEGSQLSVE